MVNPYGGGGGMINPALFADSYILIKKSSLKVSNFLTFPNSLKLSRKSKKYFFFTVFLEVQA